MSFPVFRVGLALLPPTQRVQHQQRLVRGALVSLPPGVQRVKLLEECFVIQRGRGFQNGDESQTRKVSDRKHRGNKFLVEPRLTGP
jgi:hypothetical protein